MVLIPFICPLGPHFVLASANQGSHHTIAVLQPKKRIKICFCSTKLNTLLCPHRQLPHIHIELKTSANYIGDHFAQYRSVKPTMYCTNMVAWQQPGSKMDKYFDPQIKDQIQAGTSFLIQLHQASQTPSLNICRAFAHNTAIVVTNTSVDKNNTL